MNKQQSIDDIFNILVQYEKIDDPNAKGTEETYRNYLNRLNVWYLGYGNEEIRYAIEGLYRLGKFASHDTVKRMVFYMIDILDKEAEYNVS